MNARTTLALAVTAMAALTFTAVSTVAQDEAQATPAFKVQEANPTITITNEGGNPPFIYSPDKLDAKVGQAITIVNKDPNAVHSVTAKDKSFSVDAPPNGSVTLTVKKAGTYDYYCTYHAESHNPASLNIS